MIRPFEYPPSIEEQATASGSPANSWNYDVSLRNQDHDVNDLESSSFNFATDQIDSSARPGSGVRVSECSLPPVTGPCSQFSWYASPVPSESSDFKSELPSVPNTFSAKHRNMQSNAVSDFRFESGAIPIEPQSSISSKTRKPRDPNDLKCQYPGCRSTATFKRKYELNRHMQKHDKPLPCPVVHCERRDLRPYYRIDKLTDHLRIAHREDEDCLCPVTNCTAVPMTFDLFKLHARNHSYSCFQEYAGIGCPGRVSIDARQCAIENCQKWLPISEMQNHLRSHKGSERLRERTVIEQMGYDAATTKIVCPVPLCNHRFRDHAEFAEHVEAVHLTTDMAHLDKFRQHMRNWLSRSGRYSFTLGRAWQSWGGFLQYSLSKEFCPACGESCASEDGIFWRIDHHLVLLKDPNEVRPYRREILRVCPEFSTHPVFSDILPPTNLRENIRYA